MKIKALWGFIGDSKRLGAESPRVKSGQVFADVDPEYGHALVGKGLAEEVRASAAPAAPRATKPAGPKEAK